LQVWDESFVVVVVAGTFKLLVGQNRHFYFVSKFKNLDELSTDNVLIYPDVICRQ